MIAPSKGRASRAVNGERRRRGLGSWVCQPFVHVGSAYVPNGEPFTSWDVYERRPDQPGQLTQGGIVVVPQNTTEQTQCRTLAGFALYLTGAATADIDQAHPDGAMIRNGAEVAQRWLGGERVGTYTVPGSPGPLITSSGDPLVWST